MHIYIYIYKVVKNMKLFNYKLFNYKFKFPKILKKNIYNYIKINKIFYYLLINFLNKYLYHSLGIPPPPPIYFPALITSSTNSNY